MIHKEVSGRLVGGEILWNKEERKYLGLSCALSKSPSQVLPACDNLNVLTLSFSEACVRVIPGFLSLEPILSSLRAPNHLQGFDKHMENNKMSL